MKIKLLFLLLFSFGTGLSAQTFLRGTIVDEVTLRPIENAKIGVFNQGVGVISDSDGKFLYRKYDKVLDRDSKMIVNASGYKTLEMDIENLRAIYDMQAKIVLSKGDNVPKEKANAIHVYWDVSEGMLGRDEERELDWLEAYLRQMGSVTVNFSVFNHKILFWKKEIIRNGDITNFRNSIKNMGYRGPADYSLIQMGGAYEVLLFSNGNNALGYLDTQQDVPIIIATTKEKYRDEERLKLVAQYTSGRYIDLLKNPITVNSKKERETVYEQKLIRGFVSSEGKALQGATLQIKGTFDEITTDANGQFAIEAQLDDVLICSYAGMFSREVLVTNKALTIDLIPRNNILDEVVITAKKENFIVNDRVIRGEKIDGGPGGITGRGYYYITAKDIIASGKDLIDVLDEKFSSVKLTNDALGNPGVTVAGITYSFFINGTLYMGGALPYYIKDTDINSIIIKDDPDELGIKYGIIEPIGYGIIVTTKQDTDLQNKFRYTALEKGNDYKESLELSDDAIVSATEIQGTVKSLGNPIEGASILLKGSFTEVFSKSDGSFAIEASSGDELSISYLGMFPKKHKITDSKTVEIELIPKNDVLDEVVITGSKEEIIVSGKKITGNIHPSIPGGFTALGDFYVTAKDIVPNALTLERVVRDKFKNVILSYTPYGEVLTVKGRPPQYVVDGFLLGPGEPPPFYLPDNEIESIIVKESPNLTSRYSITPISGLAIIITTKRGAGTMKMADDLLVKNNTYTEGAGTSERMIVSAKQDNITGRVTSLDKPLQGVSLTRNGSYEEYKTDANGNFKIPAKPGDRFKVTFLGMYSKEFMVESLTNPIKIKLLPTSDVLDEITLNAKKNNIEPEYAGAMPDIGKYKINNTYVDVITLTNKDVNFESAATSTSALNGKLAGLEARGELGREVILIRGQEPHIFIDGIPVDLLQFQSLPPQLIKAVSIKKGLYGSVEGLQGPVIFVDTILNENSAKSKPGSALVKGNEYEEENLGQLYNNASITNVSNKKSIVRGVVSSEGRMLQGATVMLKGTFDEVYTDDKGIFSMEAAPGDILAVKYIGMFPKEMLVEYRKSNYVIDLIPKNSSLDEIVVQGVQRVDNTIETSYGEESEDKLGYAVAEIKNESFNTGATTLRDLITGRFSGVTVQYNAYEGTAYRMRSTGSINNDVPPIWVVNGTPYQQEPSFLDVQQIVSISALKGLKAVSKYGTIARGGAFVITTLNASFDDEVIGEKKRSGLIEGNNYIETRSTSNVNINEPDYIISLRAITSANEQLVAYQSMARTQELSLEFYSDIINYFQKQAPTNADIVRGDLAYISRNNTKALRTLAYLYEDAQDYKKMLHTYERILTIAPQEAQSYRDFANALVINKKYNKALELYRNMLGERIKGVNFKGLEPVLRTELSSLVQLRKDKIEFDRLPNSWLRADFKQDVRMVIEWSDASAPFEFQFVNPDKKFYKWMHTLEDNRERLMQEKKEGFQMEEFVIDDAPQGEWIINVQYLGEDQDYALPPFLKYTIYRNYGTPRETKQMRVIKLFKQGDKVTLGKIEI